MMNRLLKGLALFLLITVGINIIVHVTDYWDFGEILWYCNYAAIILAIGIFLRNAPLIGAVLVSALGAQFLWIIDYIMTFFGAGMGRTAWLFDMPSYIFILSTILHAILIPIGIYACYKIGYSKRSYKYFFVLFIVLMLPLTFFFTSPYENRNCVFFDCDLNWQDHRDIIEANEKYMTFGYLVQNLVFWTVTIGIIHFALLYLYRRFGKIVD